MQYIVALAVTESSDKYVFIYENKPNFEDVIEKVWKDEGEAENLNWYLDTTAVYFFEGIEIQYD